MLKIFVCIVTLYTITIGDVAKPTDICEPAGVFNVSTVS